MSGSVGIEVAIVGGVNGLMGVLEELGLAFRQLSELKTDDGQKHAVAGMIEDRAGGVVGVKLDKKTGQVELVPKDCHGQKGKALANRVAQKWAHLRVVEELRKKGYRVAREETQADGTIKVVAERWG